MCIIIITVLFEYSNNKTTNNYNAVKNSNEDEIVLKQIYQGFDSKDEEDIPKLMYDKNNNISNLLINDNIKSLDKSD
ncbi:hypothetical protein SAMN02745912_01495 [Paramaledivibacter caminithermalis DSM 15212]|uniref:Uncharacterized protein n=2 Tax=Paramaledivibacter TaxID=1884934 RepID=A0A1M6N043_PARC5|nr:hypothetical protein SAMN02745912_01495 [Paramaledivibacter caminithermalis DSM 15212]